MRSTILTVLAAITIGAFVLPANATIIGGSVTVGSGSFVKLFVPFTESNPDNTVGDDTFQDDNLYGFDEGQNILITSPIDVDDIADGLGGGTGPGTLATGTVVASHYVFFDPGPSTSQEGTVEFDSDILAIISSTGNLAASDFLINTGVTYLNPSARGLESGDSVTITGLREITVDWRASTPGDYVRVLTTFSPGAVPEPGSLLLVVVGVAALGARRRRR